MKKEIRILMVEDIVADAVLIQDTLRAGGFAFRARRVDSEESFLYELKRHPPDIILLDHGLPSFDGFAALMIARDKCPEIPCIFVAGAMQAEVVIDSLRAGARDYVLKNRLGGNLVSVVRRVVREAEERAEHKRAEAELAALRDLLPMCPSCKRRRTNEANWKRLEKFFEEYPEARCRLCPNCVQGPSPGTKRRVQPST